MNDTLKQTIDFKAGENLIPLDSGEWVSYRLYQLRLALNIHVYFHRKG